MIRHCRDLDLLSTTVILFLIGGSELFFADMNGFPLNMIFAIAEDTDIAILPAGNTTWIADVTKPITLVNSEIDVAGSVSKLQHFVFTFCIFSSVRDISRLTELIFSPKNPISCTGVKTDFFLLITKPTCFNKKITVLRHMLISSMEWPIRSMSSK